MVPRKPTLHSGRQASLSSSKNSVLARWSRHGGRHSMRPVDPKKRVAAVAVTAVVEKVAAVAGLTEAVDALQIQH